MKQPSHPVHAPTAVRYNGTATPNAQPQSTTSGTTQPSSHHMRLPKQPPKAAGVAAAAAAAASVPNGRDSSVSKRGGYRFMSRAHNILPHFVQLLLLLVKTVHVRNVSASWGNMCKGIVLFLQIWQVIFFLFFFFFFFYKNDRYCFFFTKMTFKKQKIKIAGKNLKFTNLFRNMLKRICTSHRP